MQSNKYMIVLSSKDHSALIHKLPVSPLQLLKGTHHRSEFHGERVCFF